MHILAYLIAQSQLMVDHLGAADARLIHRVLAQFLEAHRTGVGATGLLVAAGQLLTVSDIVVVSVRGRKPACLGAVVAVAQAQLVQFQLVQLIGQE